MSDRQDMLRRVREALRVRNYAGGKADVAQASCLCPADRLVHPGDTGKMPVPRAFLPPAEGGCEDLVRQFAQRSDALKAEFLRVADIDGARAALRDLAEGGGWTRVGTHQHELTDAVCSSLKTDFVTVDGGYDAASLERCDAGITACDALIAQTGSVLVTDRSAGGRVLSVLPPHHVVLASRSQVVADLPAAYEYLRATYAPDYPRFISLITGPSRTGDIERILVLGAHGPRRLTVILLDRDPVEIV